MCARDQKKCKASSAFEVFADAHLSHIIIHKHIQSGRKKFQMHSTWFSVVGVLLCNRSLDRITRNELDITAANSSTYTKNSIYKIYERDKVFLNFNAHFLMKKKIWMFTRNSALALNVSTIAKTRRRIKISSQEENCSFLMHWANKVACLWILC